MLRTVLLLIESIVSQTDRMISMAERKEYSAQGSTTYLVLIACSGAIGGLLFGYDTAVISGAIGFLKEHFQLAADMTGWAASSLLIGCMIGALLGGPLGDRFGRKPMLIVCAAVFALSGLGSAVAPDLAAYTWSRLAGGLGIGAVSVLSPLYIAEISPEKSRGRFVSLYQLAIVVGILVSFFVNMLIQRYGAEQPPVMNGAVLESWNAVTGWRWMLGVLALPSVIFGLLLLPLPESPRWLMKRGLRAQAEVTLTRIGGSEAAKHELAQIEESLNAESGKLSELFHGGFGKAMVIGCLLAIFQQVGGINAIMYYGPELFKFAGTADTQAFVSTVVIGLTNVLATFGAIALIDRIGRKTLLIIGVSIQVFALAAVGTLYHLQGSPVLLLASILLFIIGFAGSSGAVTWVIISEIFPNRIRGQAMGIAVLVLWAADYLVSQTFPMLAEGIGPANTFYCYAFCAFIGLVYTIFAVPETKGRTLEEIERSWLGTGSSEGRSGSIESTM
jgi:MFS transporter, SP family, arabinose:H+ symporter